MVFLFIILKIINGPTPGIDVEIQAIHFMLNLYQQVNITAFFVIIQSWAKQKKHLHPRCTAQEQHV